MVCCRICLEPPVDCISPCACAGSCGLVHRRCLETWQCSRRTREAFLRCPTCNQPYAFGRKAPRLRSRRRICGALVGRGLLGLFLAQGWLIALALLLAVGDTLYAQPPTRFAERFRQNLEERALAYYLVALLASLAALGLLALFSCTFRDEPSDAEIVCFDLPCPEAATGEGDAVVLCFILLVLALAVLGVFVLVAFIVMAVQAAWQRQMVKESLRDVCSAYPVLDVAVAAPHELDASFQEELRQEILSSLATVL